MIRKIFSNLKRYFEISGVGVISRRYFVMNSFDGAMTMLGIIMGSFAVDIVNPRMVIGAGFGASLAMMISGFTGAYMTERAERRRGLIELERAMLKPLNNSIHGKAMRVATLWAALVDGLSPALAAIICLIPFFLSSFNILSLSFALYSSIGIILGMLFVL